MSLSLNASTFNSTPTRSTPSAIPAAITDADMQKFKLVLACIYLVLGLSMITIDGSLALTILLTKDLRKRIELIFIFGQFVADVIFGLAFFTSAVNRFIVFANHLPPITPMQCILKPFLVLFIFGQLLSAFMMFMMSVDRLVCECFIFFYTELGRWYRYLGFGVPLSVALGITIAAWLVAMVDMPQVAYIAPECSQNLALTTDMNEAITLAQHITALGSIALYGSVLLVYWLRRHQPVPEGIAKVQRRRQKEHTKVLSFVCATNFVFYTVPSIFVLPGTNITAGWPTMVAMCVLYFSAISRGLCAIANAAVFLVRPTDLRDHLFLFLKRIFRTKSGKVGDTATTGVPSTTIPPSFHKEAWSMNAFSVNQSASTGY